MNHCCDRAQLATYEAEKAIASSLFRTSGVIFGTIHRLSDEIH
jgi:hypothetical protein